jgi:uncharacterized protein (DUF1015 family)
MPDFEMAIVRPFEALRPVPERASEVAAVPYDVVTTEEARALASGNPRSFLHVSRAEIDLPEGTDPHSREVYRKAAENLERLTRDVPLMRESERAFYVYRLRMGDHVQTGIAGVFSVDEYDSDRIRKHERTRRDKEDDRTRHIIALLAQTGPVFLTYRDRPAIDELVAGATHGKPLYDFEAEDGVAHTIWLVGPEASARLEEEFENVPLLYIADGHHRAASASRAREEFRDRSDRAGAESEYDFFLGVAFPAGQVRILPYNRLVGDLGGRSPEEFLFALKQRLSVSTDAPPAPARRGEVSMYLSGRWYGLRLPSVDPSRPALDVTLLHDAVFEPLLGVKDVRSDKRIEFVGGARGTAALERAVDERRAAVAFSLYPVGVEDLIRISDANEIMPPKSTWFEPKLRDGLLIHEI